TGTNTLVSAVNGGTAEGDDDAEGVPVITPDGRFVVFVSLASNLSGATDNNADDDVFVRDLQTNTTTLMSVAADGSAAGGVDPSETVDISDDGLSVVFASSTDVDTFFNTGLTD